MRESNQAAGKTWTYAYDSGGNILSKTEYAYTTGSLGVAVHTIPYGYDDTAWSDLLTSIDGQSLTTDEIGNLLSDGTWAYTWQHGRQLAGIYKSGTDIAYRYDADGLRISKTVNGTTYNYFYLGDQLTEMTWGSNRMHFTYDAVGPLSLCYNGTEYFYLKNAQGDVTGIADANGKQLVWYKYDEWGKLLRVYGSGSTTLGAANPLRYRGYVYDTETGLYYLQSRYYNPSWGRFIGADDIGLLLSAPGKAHWDKNVFAYCDNNPLNRVDGDGECWGIVIGALVGGVVSGASSIVNDAIMGRETTVVSVLASVAVGAVAGGVSAAVSIKHKADILTSTAAGIITFTGSLVTGTGLIESLLSATTAAVSTYLSAKLGNDLSGETGKGIVNLVTSGNTEGIASAGRGVYKATTRRNQSAQVKNPAVKAKASRQTPMAPKVPTSPDRTLQDWRRNIWPPFLQSGGICYAHH